MRNWTISARLLCVSILYLTTFACPVFAQPETKHGLHFKEPSMVWDEAIPLGNGLLGGLVWGDGTPLKISLDRTDLWDLRPVPEFEGKDYSYKRMQQWVKEGRLADLHRLYDFPYGNAGPTKIPAGRIEITLSGNPVFKEASLDLKEATSIMKFDNGCVVKVFIDATQQVGLIDIFKAESIEPTIVAPSFAGEVKDPAGPNKISAGDLASLGYKAPVISKGRNFTAFTQEGWDGFTFAVVLSWRIVEDRWLGVWSIANSNEENDPQALALKRCEEVHRLGFPAVKDRHELWWKGFWDQSSVTLPNAIIERQWYLETYKFGSAARESAPPITLQGPWTADNGKIPPWKGDYHHDLNTELSYWPCYSGNHLNEGIGFLNWLWKTRKNAEAWTRRFFDLPGLNVPMTADLNNNQIGGWHQYTHSSTTAAWLAHHFYLHWRYSMDRDFLERRAYPYIKEVATFLDAVLEKGEDGRRFLPLSSSPEINDNRLEAWFPSITNYDLALCRWLFTAAAELAGELGLEEDVKQYKRILTKLPGFALHPDDRRLLVAKGYPLNASHRHFSHLMAVHPLGLIRWENGRRDQEIIKAALEEMKTLGTKKWTGYSFSWQGCVAARARNGELAEQALEIFSTAFCLRNSFHCNGDQSGKGYSNFRYRPFTLEGNFAAAAAVQEMLLQSYSGVIVIFPSVPYSWNDVSFKTLRAEGAFLVSAKRKSKLVQRVEILSKTGGLCRLYDPFSGSPFETEGIAMPLIQKDGEIINMEMEAGQRIVLVRKQ